jgi:molecular chaperone GrpE
MAEEHLNGGQAPGDGVASPQSTDEPRATEGVAAEAQAAPAGPTPEERIAQLERERDELKDRLLRTAADFENHRKRSRREIDEAQRAAKESVVREFLPVIDNLERALASVTGQPGSTDVTGLAKGVELVLKLFADTLGRFGVKGFVSKGTPFDPQLHEAIQQVETSEYPPGTVVQEFQKGYLLNDRLVRPAMVVVAKAPSPAAGSEGAGSAGADGADKPGGHGTADAS